MVVGIFCECNIIFLEWLSVFYVTDALKNYFGMAARIVCDCKVSISFF